MNPNFAKTATWCYLVMAVLGMVATGQVAAQSVAETKEIVFSSTDAQLLKAKADELKTPVAIYEYVRNTAQFKPYWGSSSGSVNTFLGQLGNDVDIASTLIAMLRSQGIPARYAVATVRAPISEVTNWLGVGTPEVAVNLLINTSTPNAQRGSYYTDTINFEHVWVEALVPFDSYRGLPVDSTSVNCITTPTKCAWVPMDASFKQKKYKSLQLDPFASVKWGDAQYTSYYDAVKNNDDYRRDKGLLLILEQDVLQWLRANSAYNGYTLDDVIDKGEIIETHEGLLPASLPYQLQDTPRKYDTVAAHDAAETNKWDRKVKITVLPCQPDTYTGASTSQEFSLTELSTDRLMLTNTQSNGNINLNLWRGRGAQSALVKTWSFGTVACAEGSKNFATGTQFYIQLDINQEPNFTPPKAVRTAVVGGRYLLALGGETSNWSQVHRAATKLLEASQLYKIVYDASKALPGQTCKPADGTGCVPFIDSGTAGWDANDVALIDNQQANNDLVGGLLEVAAAQYYVKFRDQHHRASGLMRVSMPIRHYLGVIRSAYDVQYLKDATAFSVQPNGLVIDVFARWTPPYRLNSTSNSPTTDHAFFIGHLGSSLEHEIWQELTGFDAVSTVRSIQLSRAANSPLKTYNKTTSINDKDVFASDMGFSNSPTGQSFYPLDAVNPTLWMRNVSEEGNITRYSAPFCRSQYEYLKLFSPSATNYRQIKITQQPALGTGYKSDVFISRELLQDSETGTFGIIVTGR